MTTEGYLAKGHHIDRYHALEVDFLKFLDFLPLEFYPSIRERQCIRSMYLADLLLRIGSNIDIFFYHYILSNHKDFINGKDLNRLNWGNYKELDKYLLLSDKHVKIIPTTEVLYPFRLAGIIEGRSWVNINMDEILFWWNSYNKVKHEGIFDRATLDNVVQALAALFLLICIDKAIHVKKFFWYGYTDLNPQWSQKIQSKNNFGGKYANIGTKLFMQTR